MSTFLGALAAGLAAIGRMTGELPKKKESDFEPAYPKFHNRVSLEDDDEPDYIIIERECERRTIYYGEGDDGEDSSHLSSEEVDVREWVDEDGVKHTKTVRKFYYDD